MKHIAIFIGVIFLLLVAWVSFFPSGRAVLNNYTTTMRKVDDRTMYEQRRTVEDTCRAMISSYTSDVLTYKQFKDYEVAEKRNWAEQAKMRANKTASSYNNFILKNRFLWQDNVPFDIDIELAYVD